MHALKAVKYKMKGKKEDWKVVDEEYDRAEKQFLEHFTSAKGVLAELRQFQATMQRMAEASSSLGRTVGEFYQVPQVPAGVETFRNAQDTISQRVSLNMEGEFASNVIAEWEEYCGLLRALQAKISERRQKVQSYEYYKAKMQSLAEASKQDEEQIARNRTKFSEAETEYNTLNQELTTAFQNIYHDSQNAFNARLNSMIGCLGTTFDAFSEASATMGDVANNPSQHGVPTNTTLVYKALIEQYGTMEAKSSSRFAPSLEKLRRPSLLSARGTGSGTGGGQQTDPPASPSATTSPSGQESRDSWEAPAATTANRDSDEFVTHQPDKQDEVETPPPIVGSGKNPFGQSEETEVNQESQPKAAAASDNPFGPETDDPSLVTKDEPAGGERVKCLFEFTGAEETELSFGEGDILTIESKGDDGWWTAVDSNGKRGLIPHNYVEPAE